MIANDLAPEVWNAIASEISRQAVTREIVFAVVTKRDTAKLHIFCDDFGDVAIPLVGFPASFAYYDTQADGSVAWRGDRTQVNTAFHTEVVMPAVGDVAVILDLAGTKTYPICIGVLLSKPGFWEGD
jgi:hypothetical protein